MWNAKCNFIRIWRVPPTSAEVIQTRSSLWQNGPKRLLEGITDQHWKALEYVRKPKPDPACIFLMPCKTHSGRSAQKLCFNKFLLTTTSPMSNQVWSTCIAQDSSVLLHYDTLRCALTWRITESLRLEKTPKIVKSNCQPNTTVPAKSYPELQYLHVLWIPPGMGTPPLPWAAWSTTWGHSRESRLPKKRGVTPALLVTGEIINTTNYWLKFCRL